MNRGLSTASETRFGTCCTAAVTKHSFLEVRWQAYSRHFCAIICINDVPILEQVWGAGGGARGAGRPVAGCGRRRTGLAARIQAIICDGLYQ